MKYIMYENKDGTKFPVVFSERLVHAHMDLAVPHAARRGNQIIRPVSAGFVNLETFATYGESESMGLKSKKEDGLYIWGGTNVCSMPPEMIQPLFERSMSKRG